MEQVTGAVLEHEEEVVEAGFEQEGDTFEEASTVENSTTEPTTPQGHVSISIKRVAGLGRRTINALAQQTGARMEETSEFYVLSAPHIRITRADAQSIMGNMTDIKWRMLFVKREGEVKAFNDAVFEIGNPLPITEERSTDSVAMSVINTRIPTGLKEDMETSRELLGLNQREFIEKAIAELVAQVKEVS